MHHAVNASFVPNMKVFAAEKGTREGTGPRKPGRYGTAATKKTLGLTVSSSLLARADELIE